MLSTGFSVFFADFDCVLSVCCPCLVRKLSVCCLSYFGTEHVVRMLSVLFPYCIPLCAYFMHLPPYCFRISSVLCLYFVRSISVICLHVVCILYVLCIVSIVCLYCVYVVCMLFVLCVFCVFCRYCVCIVSVLYQYVVRTLSIV